MWGLNPLLGDQELHVILTEPTGHPNHPSCLTSNGHERDFLFWASAEGWSLLSGEPETYSLSLDFQTSETLWRWGWHKSTYERWELPPNFLFSGPRILATMLNTHPIPACRWGISFRWKCQVIREKTPPKKTRFLQTTLQWVSPIPKP